MSWPAPFKAWLEAPYLPRFAVRGLDVPFAGASWQLPSSYTKADSHDDMSGNPIIAAQGIRQTSPERLDTSRWVCAGGEWQVTLAVAPDSSAGQWLTNLRRGQIFQVLAGPHTAAEVDLEPIALGVLYNVRISSAQRGMVLTLRSIMSAFGSRQSNLTGSLPLFADIDDPSTRRQTTISGTAYTVGDTSLEVVSTTGFEEDSANAGVRLLLVDPGGTPGTISGAAFYLKATGTATGPVRFTGVGTTNLYGTTRATAAIGSPVYQVPFVYGHPIDVAQRFAQSTGAGTSTFHDSLPSPWGLNLPGDCFDTSDASLEKSNATATSGTYELEVLATQQEQNPLAWMQNWLAPHGITWSLRQGRLTLRAPHAPGRAPVRTGVVITDNDITSFALDAFDPAQIPYRRVRYNDATGTSVVTTSTSAATTLPYNDELTTNFPHLWSNTSNSANGVNLRLLHYRRNVGSILAITCAGWRLAQLCAGDDCEVTSSYFLGREYNGSTAITSRPYLVLSVAVDWTVGAPSVQLVLMELPDVAPV